MKEAKWALGATLIFLPIFYGLVSLCIHAIMVICEHGWGFKLGIVASGVSILSGVIILDLARRGK